MATILHVDMDAFYAAVEVRAEPSLAGQPVIVGGDGRRGVVAAASYEARAYGVRSAMPSGVARRLCPHAIFIPGHFDRYNEVSQELHEIFHGYTPLVEGIGLDEAFLDVTGAAKLFGDGAAVAHRIRAQVLSQLRLSASVGVATTKFLAKLASEAAKPRASPTGVAPGAGVVVVEPGCELAFLHPLPVEALWGVGPVTATRLRGLGITTIGDLASVPLDSLERSVGSAVGRHLHELAQARDPRRVEPNRAVQSIGHEETYPWDRHDKGELHREVVRMADAVASRLRAAGVTGRTVTLKLRYGDFSTITRSRTTGVGIDTGPAIARAAAWLLDRESVDAGVRLLGVSVGTLTTGAAHQLSLGLSRDPSAAGSGTRLHTEGSDLEPSSESADISWHDAARAVDQVRARFGSAAVGPAALVGPGGVAVKRQGDSPWGPSAGASAGASAGVTGGASAAASVGVAGGASVGASGGVTAGAPTGVPRGPTGGERGDAGPGAASKK